MKKKKALLFPYDISLLHMVTNRDLMVEYEIVNVVSLKSWGYGGEDAGAKLGIHTGIVVREDFDEALEEVDTVIIADTKIYLDCSLLGLYISKAENAGKEILDTRRLPDKKNLADEEKSLYLDVNKEVVPQLIEINRPVIMVVGTGENTGKFDVQMYARDAFVREGYKVSQIGSKAYCELWGVHSFPNFMNGRLSGAEKIIKFNHYVNHIINAEEPDVVIVGVPGGVVPISDKLLDDFGIMNYMIANAVKPDYVILNTGFVDYNMQYIETIVSSLKYRLDYDVDSIFLSNYFVNWGVTDTLNRLVYTTIPMDITNREAKKCGCYALYNRKDIEMFKKKMISTLMGYSDYDAI